MKAKIRFVSTVVIDCDDRHEAELKFHEWLFGGGGSPIAGLSVNANPHVISVDCIDNNGVVSDSSDSLELSRDEFFDEFTDTVLSGHPVVKEHKQRMRYIPMAGSVAIEWDSPDESTFTPVREWLSAVYPHLVESIYFDNEYDGYLPALAVIKFK